MQWSLQTPKQDDVSPPPVPQAPGGGGAPWCTVSDARTRAEVRRLAAKDQAVAALVRDGMEEQDAQREVWGVASSDVATVQRDRGRGRLSKIHLVRARRPEGSRAPFWTLCGKDGRGEVTWRPPGPFGWKIGSRVNPVAAGIGIDHCRSCAATAMGWVPRERQQIQAMRLGVEPYACRRGEHEFFPDEGEACRWCGHVALPLFGRA